MYKSVKKIFINLNPIVQIRKHYPNPNNNPNSIQHSTSSSPRTNDTTNDTTKIGLRLFEHPDITHNILNRIIEQDNFSYQTFTDLRNLRAVCKKTLEIFEQTYSDNHPIKQFWQRTFIQIYWPTQYIWIKNELKLKNAFITEQCEFTNKFNIYFIISFNHHYNISLFLEFINNKNNSDNSNIQTVANSIHEFEFIDHQILKDFLITISNLHAQDLQNSFFKNLTVLSLTSPNLLLNESKTKTYPTPNCIKTLKFYNDTHIEKLQTLENIQSLHIETAGESHFTIKSFPNLQYLTIAKLYNNISIHLEENPNLKNININGKETIINKDTDKIIELLIDN